MYHLRNGRPEGSLVNLVIWSRRPQRSGKSFFLSIWVEFGYCCRLFSFLEHVFLKRVSAIEGIMSLSSTGVSDFSSVVSGGSLLIRGPDDSMLTRVFVLRIRLFPETLSEIWRKWTVKDHELPTDSILFGFIGYLSKRRYGIGKLHKRLPGTLNPDTVSRYGSCTYNGSRSL